MIELVSSSRCIACDMCVRVCPTNVFDPGADGVPVIARQADCQTCFICEIYCPVDALFVSPAIAPEPVGSDFRDEAWLERSNYLGAYRRAVGWGRGLTNLTVRDPQVKLITMATELIGRMLPGPPTAEPAVGASTDAQTTEPERTRA
jgi:NAD-dependent dihydropyrimidine dehydrogenase PreA subunit